MHAKPIIGSLQYLATPNMSSNFDATDIVHLESTICTRQPSISAVRLAQTWRSMGLCRQNLNSGSLAMGKFLPLNGC